MQISQENRFIEKNDKKLLFSRNYYLPSKIRSLALFFLLFFNLLVGVGLTVGSLVVGIEKGHLSIIFAIVLGLIFLLSTSVIIISLSYQLTRKPILEISKEGLLYALPHWGACLIPWSTITDFTVLANYMRGDRSLLIQVYDYPTIIAKLPRLKRWFWGINYFFIKLFYYRSLKAIEQAKRSPFIIPEEYLVGTVYDLVTQLQQYRKEFIEK